MSHDDQEYQVCKFCYEETREVAECSVCANCGIVEGNTVCLTETEIEFARDSL